MSKLTIADGIRLEIGKSMLTVIILLVLLLFISPWLFVILLIVIISFTFMDKLKAQQINKQR